MYGYVDLIDGRHIVCRQIDRSGISASNVHCRTPQEAEILFNGMRKNLEQGFSITETHSLGFKYFVGEKYVQSGDRPPDIGQAVGQG